MKGSFYYGKIFKNILTSNALLDIICVTCYKEGGKTIAKSRADYMKSRREGKKNFSVLIDKDKAEKLEEKLVSENKTKSAWLEEKIDEELKK